MRDVGQAIKQCIREIDIVGRYSGEAFLVILPSTNIFMGRITADRIRSAVADLRWENGEVRLTISGGLVELGNSSLSELLKNAEKNLVLAKSQGGDCVIPQGIALATVNRT